MARDNNYVLELIKQAFDGQIGVEVIVYSSIENYDQYLKEQGYKTGNVDATVIANKFNGGGHKNAAGGEFRGTLQECVDVFMSILDDNDKLLNK